MGNTFSKGEQMQQYNLLYEKGKREFFENVKNHLKGAKVFFCIGTSSIFCDSFGPKFGTLLNQKMTTPIFVYGTSESNVDAQNVEKCYKFVRSLHKNEKIVVVDAGVGSSEHVGFVQVLESGIFPGAATNKTLPKMGDVSLVGIVADSSMGDFYLSSESKNRFVFSMANVVSDGVSQK